MLPVIIFVAVAVPLLVVGFVARRRSSANGENGPQEDESARLATEEEYEREFQESEEYQAKWRDEQHKRQPDDNLY